MKRLPPEVGSIGSTTGAYANGGTYLDRFKQLAWEAAFFGAVISDDVRRGSQHSKQMAPHHQLMLVSFD